jgi:sarcosine oxidase
VVSDEPDDPECAAGDPNPDALADLDRFVGEQFAAPLVRRVAVEHCFYTNTATEDFVLDLHPEDPRVVIGAGFSGHGFKFGPLTGRILADLARQGRCDLPAFVRHRSVFAARRPT